ncbi:fam-a protein [Plasmodium chabaudi chabaudi]|uniref:Fam-a protein n=1 Tax=Plasmodium chabaudi chabaudi TaxID=31271 RepID=A0A4V0K2R7_PLACU|nr:fam-a protein [Plasmodium chabaudi chabaudi]VTZ66318.1 fam-a protein [Plasmodium chabaudi chabaudi]|eukprot:XP_016653035.1 fam-a protein [Plasmodium chabaudi chabaudi]
MNKFYIQIVFFLLSVFLHVNNKILATEPTSKKATPSKTNDSCLTPEEVYEKNKHLLCTNPKEAKEAHKLMDEAIKHLEQHATNTDGYIFCRTDSSLNVLLYKKKHEEKTDIEKIHYAIYDANQYDELINEIWDPNHPNPFNKGTVKIARVYDPSLVIIQQRYKKKIGSPQKYFYALVKKTQVSEDTTVIVMSSADINDHNPSAKEYKNKIIENANLFKTEIDSEDDIRKGKLEKTVVNLAGYIIRRCDTSVNVTYVESIDGHANIYQEPIVGKYFDYYFLRR